MVLIWRHTRKWLDALGDELYFIEEMFPEQVDQDLELKAHIKRKGWKTLVADGESAREVSHFDPYVQGDALDVLQPDMRAFGFTLEWELSKNIAAKPHIKVAPHNWGSFLGLYMQLIFARGVPNVLMVEEDRSSSHSVRHLCLHFQRRKDSRSRSARLWGHPSRRRL